MYGLGDKDQGFYLLEGGREEEVVVEPNVASVVITEGEITSAALQEELNDMVEMSWDWHIEEARKNGFLVVFLSKVTLRMARMGDYTTLLVMVS